LNERAKQTTTTVGQYRKSAVGATVVRKNPPRTTVETPTTAR
jgi:hypothetical protein